MADLRDGVNATRARYQDQFNGVFGLQGNDKELALGLVLKELLPVDHKPKWALFPLYVIYELLHSYSRTNPVEKKIEDAYNLVIQLVSYFVREHGMQGLAKIDNAMIRSFLNGTLRTGRTSTDNDELTDFKTKGLCRNHIIIGPDHVTFEEFLWSVANRFSAGGKSRRRRQHRRFRSKKRGRKTLRKRRN